MQKRRILIIDNHDELRSMLAQVLGELGHEVIATGDRDEALRLRDDDHFDLIISDLAEDSRVNGQHASEVQRKQALIPPDASATEPTIVKAFKVDAVNCLRHPYAEGELREIVEQILSYKLRYVDAVHKAMVPVLAGLAAAIIATPIVWLVPLIGTGTALLFGGAVALGVNAGARDIRRRLSAG